MYHWKFPFQIMSAMKFFSSEKWAFEKKEKALAPALLDLDISVKYNFYAYNNLILGLSIISIQIGHVGIRSCNWIQSGTHATMNSTFSTVLYLSTYSLLVKKKVAIWRCLARFSAPFVSRRGVTQRIFSKSTTCVTP